MVKFQRGYQASARAMVHDGRDARHADQPHRPGGALAMLGRITQKHDDLGAAGEPQRPHRAHGPDPELDLVGPADHQGRPTTRWPPRRDLGLARHASRASSSRAANVDQALGLDAEHRLGARRHRRTVINRVRELTVQGASDLARRPAAPGPSRSRSTSSSPRVKDSGKRDVPGHLRLRRHEDDDPRPTTTATDAYQGDTGTIARTIGPRGSRCRSTPTSPPCSAAAAGDGKLIDTFAQDRRRPAQRQQHGVRRPCATATSRRSTDNQGPAQPGPGDGRGHDVASRLGEVTPYRTSRTTTTKLLSETEDTDLAKGDPRPDQPAETCTRARTAVRRIDHPAPPSSTSCGNGGPRSDP